MLLPSGKAPVQKIVRIDDKAYGVEPLFTRKKIILIVSVFLLAIAFGLILSYFVNIKGAWNECTFSLRQLFK